MINQITLNNLCSLLRYNNEPIAAPNQAQWVYDNVIAAFLLGQNDPVGQHDAIINAMLVASGENGFDVATQLADYYKAAKAMATQMQQAAAAPAPAPAAQQMPASTPPMQPAPQPPMGGPPPQLGGQQIMQVPNMPANPVSDSPEAPVATIQNAPASSPESAPAVHAAHEDGTFTCGECGQSAKSARGLKSHLTKSHELKWIDYCTKNGLNAEGLPIGTQAAPAATPNPMANIPSSSPPAGPDLSQGPTGGMPTVPAPAAVQTVAPTGPAPMAQPPATQPPVYQPPVQNVAQQTAPVQQAVPAQVPVYQPQAAAPTPAQPIAVSSRLDIANLLGGPVDLLVIPLLEASSGIDKLRGRTDANQLAQLALAQAMGEITDPDDIKFKRHRDVSLRIFGEMLTKYPNIFVFQQGYNYLLADEYLPILSSRSTKVTLVADKGNNIQTVDLE